MVSSKNKESEDKNDGGVGADNFGSPKCHLFTGCHLCEVHNEENDMVVIAKGCKSKLAKTQHVAKTRIKRERERENEA